MPLLTNALVRMECGCHTKLYLASHAKALPMAPVIDRRGAYARLEALARALSVRDCG